MPSKEPSRQRIREDAEGDGQNKDTELQSETRVRSGEAELGTAAIQDLSENVGALIKAALGYSLKFRLRLDLIGDTRPPDNTVQNVNEVLKGSSKDLRIL